jgi:hypothetical protein
MAKENTVYLYGRVKQPPRIYKNKAGQYVLGKIVVDTNRKSYATEELLLRGEIRRDSILVRTEHEEMYIRLSMKEILSRSKAHYARKNTKENLYACTVMK